MRSWTTHRVKGWANMGKIEFTDGITNQGHAQKFLRGVDLLVKEQVVREVVATLREENGPRCAASMNMGPTKIRGQEVPFVRTGRLGRL